MESEKIQFIIILFLGIFFTLILALVVIFSVFNNRKNKFIYNSYQDKLNFKSEISKAKIETKDNTLNEMSRELHDNIGQILSVAKIQVSFLKNKPESVNHKNLTELENIISKSIDEIRLLTRLTRIEEFDKIHLHEAMNQELERINLLKNISCIYHKNSDFNDFGKDHEIFIFRIFQEAISNILKHAHTKTIEITAFSDDEYYVLQIRDYGIGFDKNLRMSGSGIVNMKNRAKLINSKLNIQNEDIGTSVILKYPLNR